MIITVINRKSILWTGESCGERKQVEKLESPVVSTQRDYTGGAVRPKIRNNHNIKVHGWYCRWEAQHRWLCQWLIFNGAQIINQHHSDDWFCRGWERQQTAALPLMCESRDRNPKMSLIFLDLFLFRDFRGKGHNEVGVQVYWEWSSSPRPTLPTFALHGPPLKVWGKSKCYLCIFQFHVFRIVFNIRRYTEYEWW